MRLHALLAAALLLTSCGSGQKTDEPAATENQVSEDKPAEATVAKNEPDGPVEIPDYTAGGTEPEFAYRIGGNTARVQTFRAEGTRLHDLELLIATTTEPENPLTVEIRNDELDRRYGHGVIEASKAPGEVADWRAVTWEVTPEVELDGVYKIVAYSSAPHDVWRLVGGDDVYRFGEISKGHGWDIGFRIRFENGVVTNSGFVAVERPVRRTDRDMQKESTWGLVQVRTNVLPLCEGMFCGDLHRVPLPDAEERLKLAAASTELCSEIKGDTPVVKITKREFGFTCQDACAAHGFACRAKHHRNNVCGEAEDAQWLGSCTSALSSSGQYDEISCYCDSAAPTAVTDAFAAEVAHLTSGVSSVVQTFIATGSSLQKLELMLLKAQEKPDQPLIVEIRNERLDRRFGHGIIDASNPVDQIAEWRAVQWEVQPELTPGEDYAIVAFAQTDKDAWRIAGGLNVYPFGDSEGPRSAGKDIAFRVGFEDGSTVESIMADPAKLLDETRKDSDNEGWGQRLNPRRGARGPHHLPVCEGSICGPVFTAPIGSPTERLKRAAASSELCEAKVPDGPIVRMSEPAVGLTCADVCQAHSFERCRGFSTGCKPTSEEHLGSCDSVINVERKFDRNPSCHCTNAAPVESADSPTIADPWLAERLIIVGNTFVTPFRDKVWLIDSIDGSVNQVEGAPLHPQYRPQARGGFVAWKLREGDNYRVAFVDVDSGTAHEKTLPCVPQNRCDFLATDKTLHWMNIGKKEGSLQPLPDGERITVEPVSIDGRAEIIESWDGEELVVIAAWDERKSWTVGDDRWRPWRGPSATEENQVESKSIEPDGTAAYGRIENRALVDKSSCTGESECIGLEAPFADKAIRVIKPNTEASQ